MVKIEASYILQYKTVHTEMTTYLTFQYFLFLTVWLFLKAHEIYVGKYFLSLLTSKINAIVHLSNPRQDSYLAWCYYGRKPERVIVTPIILYS